jgi:hypothetical protein
VATARSGQLSVTPTATLSCSSNQSKHQRQLSPESSVSEKSSNWPIGRNWPIRWYDAWQLANFANWPIRSYSLLVSLPLLETTNVIGLKEVGLVQRELNHLDLIHLCLENKVVCLIACSTINEEDMLRLIRSAIIVLNEMV